jgi:hypothetical protein
VNSAEWIHRHLNPHGSHSPVQLTKFSRKNLAKVFRVLGYKRGAEIGVAEGRYSKQMCEMNPGVRLLCVDCWARYHGNVRGGPQNQHDRNFEMAHINLQPFDAEIVRAFSLDAARNVELESLDFVYIDANHAFDYVMQDIIEWSKRVRRGGIVAMHDYYHFRDAGVVEAVDAYVLAHGITEWFLTNERKEKSAFWVKR